ncbi:hypothetical protein GSI_14906 [Ganoderma sinense ZZ0214-1]|uniref:Transporter n=1 Tax=Ganoderma sinense ZZ0214-1 TaxID=1077348 RepID=A0A2G8RQ16_9APHY|nr:hypothetical protein GSI_14906 [Ganoderma sinense ZZ0214-1]
MQPSHSLTRLALIVLALGMIGMATPPTGPSLSANEGEAVAEAADEPGPSLVSHEQLMHWIANTDAELTFIGKPINPLTPRSALDTTVTYCSIRTGGVCGGPCTVYTGGAKCLHAPDTNCLGASDTSVEFCTSAGCAGSCTQLSACGTKMDNGFCFTPGTESIVVPST